MSVGKPKTVGNDLDMVEVVPIFKRVAYSGEPGEFKSVLVKPIKVYCVKQGSDWKIANIIYPGDAEAGIKSWDLKGYLNKGLQHSNSGYQGEDPATMLAIEEVLPGQWNWEGIKSAPSGQMLPPPQKTTLRFAEAGRITRHDSRKTGGTWLTGEGHMDLRFDGEAPLNFKVEKFGEFEMTLRNLSTGYYWVLRKM